jgi:hypothetical protein
MANQCLYIELRVVKRMKTYRGNENENVVVKQPRQLIQVYKTVRQNVPIRCLGGIV